MPVPVHRRALTSDDTPKPTAADLDLAMEQGAASAAAAMVLWKTLPSAAAQHEVSTATFGTEPMFGSFLAEAPVAQQVAIAGAMDSAEALPQERHRQDEHAEEWVEEQQSRPGVSLKQLAKRRSTLITKPPPKSPENPRGSPTSSTGSRSGSASPMSCSISTTMPAACSPAASFGEPASVQQFAGFSPSCTLLDIAFPAPPTELITPTWEGCIEPATPLSDLEGDDEEDEEERSAEQGEAPLNASKTEAEPNSSMWNNTSVVSTEQKGYADSSIEDDDICFDLSSDEEEEVDKDEDGKLDVSSLEEAKEETQTCNKETSAKGSKDNAARAARTKALALALEQALKMQRGEEDRPSSSDDDYITVSDQAEVPKKKEKEEEKTRGKEKKKEGEEDSPRPVAPFRTRSFGVKKAKAAAKARQEAQQSPSASAGASTSATATPHPQIERRRSTPSKVPHTPAGRRLMEYVHRDVQRKIQQFIYEKETQLAELHCEHGKLKNANIWRDKAVRELNKKHEKLIRARQMQSAQSARQDSGASDCPTFSSGAVITAPGTTQTNEIVEKMQILCHQTRVLAETLLVDTLLSAWTTLNQDKPCLDEEDLVALKLEETNRKITLQLAYLQESKKALDVKTSRRA